jgi:hypothetical protein
MPLHEQAHSKYNAAFSASQVTTPSFAVLIRTATAASILVLASLPSRSLPPTSFLLRQSPSLLLAQRLSMVAKGTFGRAPLTVIEAPKIHTSSNILNTLRILESAHPLIVAQFSDARKFAAALPDGITTPQISTDGETEVVFEWISGERHAVVSFEGDGEFGYAMRQGSRFIPGGQLGKSDDILPTDLLKYVTEI